MSMLTHLETDSGTNVDIHTATAVGSYTADGDKLIMVDVSIDQVAGNGDYVMYVTRQLGGSGSAYRILPETKMAAASGVTAISGQSGWITVRNGDVLTCYVVGLAGDTSTPDWTTRWFESNASLITLADDAITASKFDESTAFPLKSADTGSTTIARVGADSDTLETLSDQMDAIKSDTANILADTGTDGVLLSVGTGSKQIDLSSGKVLLQPTQTGVTIPTVTNLTNLPTMPTDWIMAAGVKADAVTKIQSGLATATDLSVTDGKVDAIKAKTDNLPANPAPANEYDAELAALQSSVNAIAPLDEVLIDTGTQQFTTADLIKIVAARMVGKASGGGTGTITYRNLEDTLDIVIMTVDEFGNRSEVELG